MVSKWLPLLALTLSCHTPVSGADGGLAGRGWYLGVGLGQSNASIHRNDFADGSALANIALDETSAATRLYAGYRLSPRWTFEGSRTDLGEVAFNTNSDGSGRHYQAGPIKIDIDTRAASLRALGFYPLQHHIELFAKVGDTRWESDTAFRDSSRSSSEDDIDYVIGIGTNLHWRRFGVRLEYGRYNNVLINQDDDLVAWTAGLNIRF